MTDKEMLELAAKAAGYDETRTCIDTIFWVLTDSDDWHPWNPLSDDGDALRLAVKLNLWVHVEKYGASARKAGGAWIGCESHIHGGIEQATRRAIVRAAAEIGKGM